MVKYRSQNPPLWFKRQLNFGIIQRGLFFFYIRLLPLVFAAGSKSSKSSGRSNGRKAKSPGPGLSGSERPSSVSSVHSEGDCNRRTPLTNRVWEDRPLSAGKWRTIRTAVGNLKETIWERARLKAENRKADSEVVLVFPSGASCLLWKC